MSRDIAEAQEERWYACVDATLHRYYCHAAVPRFLTGFNLIEPVVPVDKQLAACTALLRSRIDAWKERRFFSPEGWEEGLGTALAAVGRTVWVAIAHDLVGRGVAYEAEGYVRVDAAALSRHIFELERLEAPRPLMRFDVETSTNPVSVAASSKAALIEALQQPRAKSSAPTEAHSVLDCIFHASRWVGPRPADVLRAFTYCYLAAARDADNWRRRRIETYTSVGSNPDTTRAQEWDRCKVLLHALRIDAGPYAVLPDQVLAERLALLSAESVPTHNAGAGEAALRELERWQRVGCYGARREGGGPDVPWGDEP